MTCSASSTNTSLLARAGPFVRTAATLVDGDGDAHRDPRVDDSGDAPVRVRCCVAEAVSRRARPVAVAAAAFVAGRAADDAVRADDGAGLDPFPPEPRVQFEEERAERGRSVSGRRTRRTRRRVASAAAVVLVVVVVVVVVVVGTLGSACCCCCCSSFFGSVLPEATRFFLGARLPRANRKHEMPAWFFSRGSAPATSNVLTMSALPSQIATCSGSHPSGDVVCKSSL